MKKVISFRKTFFLWTLFCRSRFLFWQRGWKNPTKFRFLSQSPKTFVLSVFFFPERMLSLKEVFSKTRMQLWQPCQKVYAQWTQVLISTSANVCEVERFSIKTVPQEKFTGPVECCFKNLPQGFRPDAQYCSAQVRQKFHKNKFLKKISCARLIHWTPKIEVSMSLSLTYHKTIE